MQALRCLSGIAVAVVAAALHAGAALAGDRWDLPLAYPADNFHSINTARFARDVARATGGGLVIQVHPGGSLIKGGEIFRAVRNGQVPIGERLISALGSEDAIFELDALPFLATSFADALKLYISSKPAMAKILSLKGVKLLYAVPWPPLGLYAKSPVNSLDDLKGVSFRADSAATSRLAELMGAIPTQVDMGKLAEAFADGVATTMISSGLTGYDRKIWQHVKFWYDAHAWLPKNMVIVNIEAWQGLDAKTREAVLRSASEAEKRGWARARELADWYRQKLIDNGMVVRPPSDRLSTGFEKVGKKMIDEWLERTGDHGRQVINAYNRM